ncbi:hypothetical protein ACIG5E_33225 [Kitasatospora sp. NPDC053057]|uniref:hypothetical protein n=1 Tax=Kitasatospora sp. NPDC053057 TaxID=3364062 RepID=UPI0037CC9267
MDEHRRKNGFLAPAEMAALAETNTGCSLGPGGVQIKANQPGSVPSVGDFAAAAVERQLAYHPRSK